MSDLHCEYRREPIGIDEPAPRFSWTLASGRHGVRQISYCVRVTTEDGVLA